MNTIHDQADATAPADGRTDKVPVITLGDVARLTEGQGRGSSEDKRKAYNA